MDKKSKDYRIVMLESPYDTWNEDPRVESLFGKVVGLKLNGFRPSYPYGILPVNTTDFISDHMLVCEVQGSELIPVMGSRWIAKSKSLQHNIPFPGLTLVQSAGAKPHEEAVIRIEKTCEENARDIVYFSSWTISEEVRKDKQVKELLKDLFLVTYVRHFEQTGSPFVIAGATLRFKVDGFLGPMGHQPLAFNEKPLPPIHVAHLNGEGVLVTTLDHFSDEAKRSADQLQSHWDNRIHFKDPTRRTVNKTKQAA